MTSMSERASELIEIYGSYPMAKQFASNDLTSDLQDDQLPAYDAAFDPDPTTKRHAACDECSMAVLMLNSKSCSSDLESLQESAN